MTQPGWSKSVCMVDAECKQVISHCYRPPGPPCAAGVYMVVIWLILQLPKRFRGPDTSFSECYMIQPGWSKSARVVDMECKQVVSHCYRPPAPQCAVGAYMGGAVVDASQEVSRSGFISCHY